MRLSGAVIRLPLYGLAVGLAALVLWSLSLQRSAPNSGEAERFVSLAADEAAATARRSEGEQAGVEAARAGHFAAFQYGLPLPTDTLYQQLLWDRYSVEVHTGGCMPVADKSDWQSGFTQATKRELLRKHGHDVFEECRREAARLYAAQVTCE